MQLLPPRQRAVLVLRDVLGFRAREVAEMLESTEESVTSALKRARATLQHEPGREPPPRPGSPAEQELVERLTRAYETGAVADVVALLTDDVLLAMPPLPLEYQGRDLAARFLATVAFRDGRRYRMVATRANGQPAFAVYLRDPQTGVAHANGLLVFTLAGRGSARSPASTTARCPASGCPGSCPTDSQVREDCQGRPLASGVPDEAPGSWLPG